MRYNILTFTIPRELPSADKIIKEIKIWLIKTL